MKKLYSPILLILCVFVLNSIVFSQNNKENVIEQSEVFFGKSIDKKLHLYEINENFVLQLKFENESFIQFSVSPKYYFKENHEDWIETEKFKLLTENEFNDLITKLEHIKSNGNFLYKNSIAVVTNQTAHISHYYEKAFLKFGKRVDLRFDENDFAIRWIKINFPKKITGKIISKHATQNNNLFEVVIESSNNNATVYQITKEIFDTLEIGKKTSFIGIEIESTLINFQKDLNFNELI